MCSVVSIAVLGVVALRSGPTKTDGKRYLRLVLRGRGRELKREAGRIYFYRRGHRGWDIHWTTRSEAEAAAPECVKEYVDDWLQPHRRDGRSTGKERAIHFGEWEKKRFEALTGYDFETAQRSPAEWWEARKWDFSPNMAQVWAYLDEWRSQALLRDKLTPEWPSCDLAKDEIELFSDDHLGSHSCPFGGYREKAVKRWLRSRQRLWNFVFEAVYFPLLIFYLAYAVPTVSRKLDTHRYWCRARYAALGAVIHFGLVLPYVFGYSPKSFCTSSNKGTILYDTVLTVVEMPTLFCMDCLDSWPKPVRGAFFAVCLPLDYLFFPVLRWAHDPGVGWRPVSSGGARPAILLIGSFMYAMIGLIVGILPPRDRPVRMPPRRRHRRAAHDQRSAAADETQSGSGSR